MTGIRWVNLAGVLGISMKKLGYFVGILSFVLCFSSVSLAPLAAEERPQKTVVQLSIPEVSGDLWKKGRLKASIDSRGGITLRDETQQPFDDATFWSLRFNQALPFGRKYFEMRIEIGASHTPLWAGKLLQPILNGQEAVSAMADNGVPSFQLSRGPDGKGFLPPRAGVFRMVLGRDELSLSEFSFMTAGAEATQIRLSDFRIVVWPEKDERVFAQRPRASALPFAPNEPKGVFIDWRDGLGKGDDLQEFADVAVQLAGPVQALDAQALAHAEQWLETVPVSRVRSRASHSRVSRLYLEHLQDKGHYQVFVPATHERTTGQATAIQIGKAYDAVAQEAKKAWGAFYTLSSGDEGPYAGAHRQDKAALLFPNGARRMDVAGGWYDAGDYGRYTVNGAYSLALMLVTALHAKDALPEDVSPLAKPSQMNDAAWTSSWHAVALHELRWLLKMQRADGAVYHKVASQRWPLDTTTPFTDSADKWVMPVTTTATADFASVMLLASEVYAQLGGQGADALAFRFREAGERAMTWLRANRELEMVELMYGGYEYGGPYDDDDDLDERLFAEAAYWYATGSEVSLNFITQHLGEMVVSTVHPKKGLAWDEMAVLAHWALWTKRDQLPEQLASDVERGLRKAAHHARVLMQRSFWDIPLKEGENTVWGSNSVLAGTGWHWLMWARASGDGRYSESAAQLRHWFYGANPLGRTYVTGGPVSAEVGSVTKLPHFRPAMSGAITMPAGFLIGGPNTTFLKGDPALGRLKGKAPLRAYADHPGSFATNEIAVNWQAMWAVYLSLLMAEWPYLRE
ncbi:glycoside hydrolase family 9 protein [Polycladidibacter hongkongensis]|uniref:glycoside hydrolase family 9 protein n=1 Tax=Polycladidibacter hongkongensis TaxID=1647556 RepID=UPI00082BE092|nr:glycoside hydrolase family 9 protein [Pseudovibrio hongkongensis]